jgi:hypothetical protein
VVDTKKKAGRKPREPLPKGKEAEEELARQRRNERRRLRAEKKRVVAAGGDPDTVTLNPEAGTPWEAEPALDGAIPDAEQLKTQFWGAFNELGGQAGLVAWGRRYPKEFYAIWARMCLPKNMGDAPPENSLEDLLSKIGDDDD